jgi:hypothetical protein
MVKYVSVPHEVSLSSEGGVLGPEGGLPRVRRRPTESIGRPSAPPKRGSHFARRQAVLGSEAVSSTSCVNRSKHIDKNSSPPACQEVWWKSPFHPKANFSSPSSLSSYLQG